MTCRAASIDRSKEQILKTRSKNQKLTSRWSNNLTAYLGLCFTIAVIITAVEDAGRIHALLHQRGTVLQGALVHRLSLSCYILVVHLLCEADFTLLQRAVAQVPLLLRQSESSLQISSSPRLQVAAAAAVADGDSSGAQEGVGRHGSLGLAQSESAVLEHDCLQEFPEHLGGEDAQLILLIEVRLENLLDVLQELAEDQ